MPLRVSAYSRLHYGAEYLAYAVASIYPCVDQIYLLYSRRPTRGILNRFPNPDSIEDLVEAVSALDDPEGKIHWHIGDWWGNPGHAAFGHELCTVKGNADLIMDLDHDEVWDRDALEEAIILAGAGSAYRHRVTFIHLWRSFNWVCTDTMMPVRFYKVGGDKTKEEYHRPGKPVYHFGYAQRPELIDYKMAIHGHRGEFRWPAKQWFEQKFMAWVPGNMIGDVHPVVRDIWYPKPFDKQELPEIMREHPYWDKEIID